MTVVNSKSTALDSSSFDVLPETAFNNSSHHTYADVDTSKDITRRIHKIGTNRENETKNSSSSQTKRSIRDHCHPSGYGSVDILNDNDNMSLNTATDNDDRSSILHAQNDSHDTFRTEQCNSQSTIGNSQSNNGTRNHHVLERLIIFATGIVFAVIVSIIQTNYNADDGNNSSTTPMNQLESISSWGKRKKLPKPNNVICVEQSDVSNHRHYSNNNLDDDSVVPEYGEEEKDEISDLAKLHNALAAERIARCQNIDWFDACERITAGSGGAGARRRRRRILEEVEAPPFNYIEQTLLDSDDPSVVYDESCLRRYRLDLDGDMTFPYHASQLLRAGGNHTMALFIQHGAMRDADNYFCSFQQLVMEQGYRSPYEILVIAPDFNYEDDDGVYPFDAYWNSTKPWGDWRVGAQSDPECCGNTNKTREKKTISSFDILDQMLGVLTDRDLYPNMDKISIVGHSAGGQMIQRYAIMSLLAAAYDVDEIDWINMQFVVANPSSYTYLDERRFAYNCGHCVCTHYNCTCPESCTEPDTALSIPSKHDMQFTKWPCFDSHYNDWPYGITHASDPLHMVPYVIKSGPKRAATTYFKRNVIYMVGQNDTCNDGLQSCDSSCWKRDDYLDGEWPCFRNHMDTRCPAMLEGPFRRARGIQYMKYLESFYGKPTHHLHIIPGMGHNASGMFGSDIGLKILFGEDKL